MEGNCGKGIEMLNTDNNGRGGVLMEGKFKKGEHIKVREVQGKRSKCKIVYVQGKSDITG